MQGGSILAMTPSFNSYSSSRFAEIAVKVSREFREQRDELGLEEETDLLPEERFKDLVPENEGEDRVEVEAAEVVAEEKREGREREGGEIIEEGKEEEEEEEEDENAVEEDDDFEFAVVCGDSDSFDISADEIFSNGQIRPFYPVFDQSLLFNDDDAKLSGEAQTVRLPLGKLLIEERDPPSSSSSEADELEGVPEGTYCVWTPKSPQATPERCKKSNSTGSSKRWRFRDFLLRSNSDGKDTFIFLNPSSAKAKKTEDNKTERSRDQKAAVPKIRRNSVEVKTIAGKLKAKGVASDGAPSVSAHEIHYIRNRALKEGDRRRSYLPYRQDLVGLFANVNGLSRNLHPF